MASTASKRDCGPSEKTIVNSIIRWLNQQPNCYVVKTHGSIYSSGQPDLIGCHHGRMLALEVKRPGNKPTPLQQAVLKKWEAAGAIAAVVTSIEEVKALLNGQKIPQKGPEIKCSVCKYVTMTKKELQTLGKDPCMTCDDFKNWEPKEEKNHDD